MCKTKKILLLCEHIFFNSKRTFDRSEKMFSASLYNLLEFPGKDEDEADVNSKK